MERLAKYTAFTGKKILPTLKVNAIQAGMIVQERHFDEFIHKDNSEYQDIVNKNLSGSIIEEIDIRKIIEFLSAKDLKFISG